MKVTDRKSRAIAAIIYPKGYPKPPSAQRFLYLDEDGVGLSEIEFTDGRTLQPLPRTDTRSVIYVSGPSNSGKSYWTGAYARAYLKIKKYRDNEMYILSQVDRDKVLDELSPIRIPLDINLINDPLKPSDFQDSLIVLDDVDSISDKPLNKAVEAIQNKLLTTGRHTDTEMVITSHLMSDYKRSRVILNESTACVFFPRAGARMQIRAFLKTYGGLSPGQIARVMKLPSRWVMLSKTYPMYIIYDTGFFLLVD
jgi:hypothetical protein